MMSDDDQSDKPFVTLQPLKGSKWQKVGNSEMKKFIINKYRVLLTQALEEMVIFIPKGSIDDKTRNPKYYNSIAQYLKTCGVVEI